MPTTPVPRRSGTGSDPNDSDTVTMMSTNATASTMAQRRTTAAQRSGSYNSRKGGAPSSPTAGPTSPTARGLRAHLSRGNLLKTALAALVAIAVVVGIYLATYGINGLKTRSAHLAHYISDSRHSDVCTGWVPTNFCSGQAPTKLPNPIIESCSQTRRARDSGYCVCGSNITVEHSCERGEMTFTCLDMCYTAVRRPRDSLGPYFTVKVNGHHVKKATEDNQGAYFLHGANERVRYATHEEMSSFTGVRNGTTAGAGPFDAPRDAPKSYSYPRAGDMRQYGWPSQGGTYKGSKPNAVYLLLSRENKLPVILQTLQHFEVQVNRFLQYPYAFFNDGVISDGFKEAMRGAVSTEMTFQRIPKAHWSTPEWIDPLKLKNALKPSPHALYMDSLSYRHMCRWNSGFFYKEVSLLEYDYFWRVDDDVYYYCQIQYDPFVLMRAKQKKYAFNIAVMEAMVTIRTLWGTLKKHTDANNLEFKWPKESFLTASTERYSGCHFWSNFEIGSFELFRSKGYADFFEALDKAGGFFYERWGDAPVHTLAVMLLLRPDEVEYMEYMGYGHSTIFHTPEDSNHCLNASLPERRSGDSIDRVSETTCLNAFVKAMGLKNAHGDLRKVITPLASSPSSQKQLAPQSVSEGIQV